MKKYILSMMLFLFTVPVFASDIRVTLTKLPDYNSKTACASVENTENGTITGSLRIRVTGTQTTKSIPLIIAGGETKDLICAQFSNSEIPLSRNALVIAEFRGQNNLTLDDDTKMFSTYGLSQKEKLVEPVMPVVTSQTNNQHVNAQIAIDRISTMSTCMRHEECNAGAIDSLDYSCVVQKISGISKLISEKIPNSQYIVDALSFQCQGDVSLCSNNTFVDATCVMGNLKFVIEQLSRI